MSDRPTGPIPMRIEMATSEIEGGNTLAWADLEQVIACVAWADPRDSFARFVEPRLAELDKGTETPSGGGAGLPDRVRTLLERLRQAHVRLYGENRAQPGEPRSVRLVAVVVEEGRIYFVKGSRCWIFILRDGSASPVCVGDEPDSLSGMAKGLGHASRLSLALTSIDVGPNDILVLLGAESGEPPDPRGVARAFEQTQDLKRACDGLVNILGSESGGAAAIAMRFVPLGVAHDANAAGSGFLQDLEREFRQDLSAVPSHAPADAAAPVAPAGRGAPVAETPVALPKFLEEIQTPAMPKPAEMPPEPPPMSLAPPSPPAKPARRTAAPVFSKAAWFAALGIVIAVLVGVIGVPRGIRMLHASGANGGTLRVESNPPASAILIDGVDQETGSPATIDGIHPGSHEVRAELGPYGWVEEKVRIRAGQTVAWTPRARGALDVAAVVVKPGAVAWLDGGRHMTVPCRLDTLPVGWHEIFYEDQDLPLWQRQILVRAGETTRLRVNNGFSTNRALLRVEAWSYRKGEGLKEAAGDSVFMDGRLAGVTPYEREIVPGLHGIRVSDGRGQTWTEVADMSAGSSRVIAPRFGMGGWPRFAHREPGRVLLRGPVLLSVQIVTPDGGPPQNPRLHLSGLTGGSDDMPLSPVDPQQGSYVGMVDPRWVPLNMPVVYYFSVQTSSGETLCSELYRFTAVSEISAAMAP